MVRKKKQSVEAKIIDGLNRFAAALEGGENLEGRFNSRKIRLQIETEPFTPARVKSVRKMLGLSQSLFAQFIGASTNSVQAWEQGVRIPSPMACRFMDEISQAPDTFRARFMSLTSD